MESHLLHQKKHSLRKVSIEEIPPPVTLYSDKFTQMGDHLKLHAVKDQQWTFKAVSQKHPKRPHLLFDQLFDPSVGTFGDARHVVKHPHPAKKRSLA